MISNLLYSNYVLNLSLLLIRGLLIDWTINVLDVTKNKDDTCVDESLQNDAVDTSLGSELLDVHGDDFGRDTYDAAENVENVENSSFPSSAQTFMEAIKKNRSCQKFLRNKMLHVEARMEEIKELQKRLKTLRDFQVQCKKKIGRALSQKQDARVQLISVPKQRANKKVLSLLPVVLYQCN